MVSKSKILNHLAQVNHPGITGQSIRIFLQGANLKSDEEIFQIVDELKAQIKDNRQAMKRILGKQYDFINRCKINQTA
jgi:DNA replication protein DnaD